MKKGRHFWSYLAHFFLEWQIFQTIFVEIIKTHILYYTSFSRKSCSLWDNVGKDNVETEMPQMTIWRMRIAYQISKAANTHM